MKRFALAAAVILTACGSTAATAEARPVQHHGPVCASVTVAFRTPTGHEADLPVTVCGGIGTTGMYQCDIATGGLQANARLACARLAGPAS